MHENGRGPTADSASSDSASEFVDGDGPLRLRIDGTFGTGTYGDRVVMQLMVSGEEDDGIQSYFLLA